MKRFFAFILEICVVAAFLVAKPVNADGPVPSGPKPEGRPSVCLVLAGGGSRGFAHLPIIQEIEEMGIPIDMVVGTSIGAIVGGVYCAGYSIPEITKELYSLNWSSLINDSATSPYEKILDEHSIFRNILSADFSLSMKLDLGKGISNGQNIYTLLKELTLKYPSNLDFNDLHIPFRAVVTDMLSGEAMVLSDGDIAESIRASMSIPAIFEPTQMDGYYFIDGGIRYNLAINVAKNMGYDIIIGIDISQKVRDNPETFNSNPLVAMLNTITIGQYVSTSQLQKEADLVIYPETGAYGTLDFKKGKEIYEKGREAAELYRPELEEIRKKIYPDDYDENGNRISEPENPKTRGTYRRKSNLIPTEITIDGAYKQDEKYIKKAFNRINDKELTPENFEEFIQSIYRTGNYISVTPQIFDDGENVRMNLILKQETKKKIMVAANAELEQSISKNRVTRFRFNPDIQVRNLTGSGSVIAVRAQTLNDYGVSFYYMQPFNPNLFVQFDSSWLEENYMKSESITAEQIGSTALGDKYNYIGGTTFRSWKTNLNFGFRTDNGNLLKTNFFFDYGHTNVFYDAYLANYIQEKYGLDSEEYGVIGTENPYYATGVKLIYNLNTMDRSVFAKKGFYLNTMMECLVPLNPYGHEIKPSVLASLELRGAIPMGRHFTLDINAFAGNEFTDTLADNFLEIPFEAFSSYDRVYFPQIGEKQRFGTKKYCGMISLQVEPFDDLTILGGGIVFRLTGTAGAVANTYDQILFKDSKYQDNYPLLWTASLDAGLRFKDRFNVLLRGGVASTEDSSVPVHAFFALDIGTTMF